MGGITMRAIPRRLGIVHESKKSPGFLLLTLVILVPLATAVPALAQQPPPCGSITDELVRTPPGHKTFAPPAKGQSYIDPVFGCRVKRLTDAASEGVGQLTHAYSSVSPFNADSTRVLILRGDGIMSVRDLNGAIVRDNLYRRGIVLTGDPVWSRTDPNVLYFHTSPGNQLMSYSVASDATALLHTFTDYAKISFGNGEGDLSWDGDHLAVIGDDRYGFMYTLSTQAVTSARDLLAMTGGAPVDMVDTTPSNRFMLRWGDIRGGIALWEAAMAPLGRITTFAGHSDRAKDRDGTDVEVVATAVAPSGTCKAGVAKVRYADRAQTCLRSLDWTLVLHVSCNNIGQGWCLISTYSGHTPSTTWPAYTNEVFQVKLDGSQTTRLAHTRSTNSAYWRTPRAAVSPDGKYVLFDSDMQGPTVDVYLLSLPRASAPD